jgi:ABC-2 type transport system ATP-binding protein
MTITVDAIRTWDLTKRFGDEAAVNGLSFYVPQGSIFGLIGPSGGGKTTAVRLLTGVYRPTEGDARVLGTRPSEFGQSTRARIGYMPQEFVFYPGLTVWENLQFAAAMYGVGRGRSRRLNELLDLVELSGDANKPASRISGGMRRRLSLVATLIHDPELLFLDEPTAGIDPVLRRKMWDYFHALQAQGKTMLVTTQYVGEAAYCDLVGVLDEGRLRVVDSPEGLRRRAYGGDVAELRSSHPLDSETLRAMRDLPFVRQVKRLDDYAVEFVVDEFSTANPEMVQWVRERNITVESIEERIAPFDDVFVHLVEKDD